MEASWRRLGASWGRLGGILDVLEASWKRLGGEDREMARKSQLKAQKYSFYLDSVTSTLNNPVNCEGDPPDFEDVSRNSLIFKRWTRYKDSGPVAGRV